MTKLDHLLDKLTLLSDSWNLSYSRISENVYTLEGSVLDHKFISHNENLLKLLNSMILFLEKEVRLEDRKRT